MSTVLTRRSLILGAAGLLTGCDALGRNETARSILFSAENFHRWSQRALTDRQALAREYSAADLSPVFRSNGTRNPGTADYRAHAARGFADWRLRIDGLVARPLSLSLAQLHQMPAREQITRHDCVEGWSAIGQWRGVRLSLLLDAARMRDNARYLVFHCADMMGRNTPYYESIDLIDAFHPQTILAYALNGKALPVANGAPLRLRVERHLGYKHAKYVTRIEAVADLRSIHGGMGGYWEDVGGYDWYAGI